MKDVRDFYDPNFDFMQDSEWLSPLTEGKKLSLALNKGKRKTEDLERALYDSTNTVAAGNTLPTSSRFGSLTLEEQLGVDPFKECHRWANLSRGLFTTLVTD